MQWRVSTGETPERPASQVPHGVKSAPPFCNFIFSCPYCAHLRIGFIWYPWVSFRSDSAGTNHLVLPFALFRGLINPSYFSSVYLREKQTNRNTVRRNASTLQLMNDPNICCCDEKNILFFLSFTPMLGTSLCFSLSLSDISLPFA